MINDLYELYFNSRRMVDRYIEEQNPEETKHA